MKPKYIGIDFDGTIVEHTFPEIGQEVPGALKWMKKWQEEGHKLILYTVRSDGQRGGNVLTDAVDWLTARGIVLFGVNCNSDQGAWSNSPKPYCHIYIDDAAVGCPMHDNPRMSGRPYVDWDKVGPLVDTFIGKD